LILYADHVSEQYAGTENWICHPDLATDECRDLATTVIAPDGAQTVDELAPADAPGFDCFYVYPTTSADPDPNSDLAFDQSETETVRAQVARYASVCRVFAPVYRSITLGAIISAGAEARDVAYGDVVDAWRSYVVDHNAGRGVVLIGHSLGGHNSVYTAVFDDRLCEHQRPVVSHCRGVQRHGQFVQRLHRRRIANQRD
jgi:hypothetical protein